MKQIEETNGNGLAWRLCAVMREIEAVRMTGRNEHFGYPYMTAADLNGAVRPLLAKHGIAVLPMLDVVDQTVVTGKNRQGHDVSSLHTRIRGRIVLTTEDGEVMECPWEGESDDAGDKGLYKAQTGWMKTFLAKLLLIDVGDDPEADKRADERAEERGAGSERRPAPSNGGKPATPKQIAYVKRLMTERTTTEIEDHALKAKIEAKDMTTAEASEWIEALKDRPKREVMSVGAPSGAPPHDDNELPF